MGSYLMLKRDQCVSPDLSFSLSCESLTENGGGSGNSGGAGWECCPYTLVPGIDTHHWFGWEKMDR